MNGEVPQICWGYSPGLGPIVLNVDRTKNKKGTITSFVELNARINREWMNLCLLVTGLGKQKIILGFPWLHEYNPEINWKTGISLGEKWKNHDDASRLKDTIHANPSY